MEMLPASSKPVFGQGTVPERRRARVRFGVGKGAGKRDMRNRLQIEVRVPKWMSKMEMAKSESMIAEELTEVTMKLKGVISVATPRSVAAIASRPRQISHR
ncbi:hypothetical protein QTP88_008952 [Uroleucon formosanum]